MKKLPPEQRKANRAAYAASPKGKKTIQAWQATPKGRYKRAKDNATTKRNKAKKANRHPERYEWGLTLEEFTELDQQNCFYCNNELCGKVVDGIGLDRVDESRGYFTDNVVPACFVCNVSRNIFYSVEEMLQIARLVIDMRRRKTKEEEFWAMNCEWWVEVGETPTSEGQ